MTCLPACASYQTNLGVHAPGCPTPSLSARMSVIRAQTSPRLQPGDQGDAAPSSASPLPGAASGPVAVEAASGSIFTSRTSAVLSLLAALVVFAAAAGLVWLGVAR